MKSGNFWIYLLVMFGVTYLIRVLPFVAFRKKIENRYVRSFLAYIPYTVLGAMTFPAVLYATGSLVTALAGVAAAFAAAWRGKGLFTVAACASVTAFAVGLIPGL
ncbi:hypothetical protein C805_01373 [Eubacterium sp. 14-2]|uniref:AzlD domain-containing protein n=1 Tax=Eubacterium sp. 14-2 TaxID=1235790 RepID=UPI000339C3F4|nr:AzlD domain-containing protein [Eubacterium sp. 14-2]EOT27265.1 hypothetical protein C805_01373 [Eubacterium sp. 14-2]